MADHREQPADGDSHMIRLARYDAQFWAFVVLGLFSVGALGCFGIAAVQTSPHEAEILTTDNCPPPADL
jgi:hypothetical protein